jgi:hypothetical protein
VTPAGYVGILHRPDRLQTSEPDLVSSTCQLSSGRLLLRLPLLWALSSGLCRLGLSSRKGLLGPKGAAATKKDGPAFKFQGKDDGREMCGNETGSTGLGKSLACPSQASEAPLAPCGCRLGSSTARRFRLQILTIKGLFKLSLVDRAPVL